MRIAGGGVGCVKGGSAGSACKTGWNGARRDKVGWARGARRAHGPGLGPAAAASKRACLSRGRVVAPWQPKQADVVGVVGPERVEAAAVLALVVLRVVAVALRRLQPVGERLGGGGAVAAIVQRTPQQRPPPAAGRAPPRSRAAGWGWVAAKEQGGRVGLRAEQQHRSGGVLHASSRRWLGWVEVQGPAAGRGAHACRRRAAAAQPPTWPPLAAR